MECVCRASDLFCFGCRCGYYANAKLKLLFNGRDFVIARNTYHATFILDFENLKSTNKPWRTIPDEEYVTFFIGSPEGECLMAEEWISVLGEGYAVAVE